LKPEAATPELGPEHVDIGGWSLSPSGAIVGKF